MVRLYAMGEGIATHFLRHSRLVACAGGLRVVYAELMIKVNRMSLYNLHYKGIIMSAAFPKIANIPVFFDGHNDTLLALHFPDPSGGKARHFFTQSEQGHIHLPRCAGRGHGRWLLCHLHPIPVQRRRAHAGYKRESDFVCRARCGGS